MMRLTIDVRKYRDFGIGTYIKELAHAFDQEAALSTIYLVAPEDAATIGRTHRGEVLSETSGKYSLRELFMLGNVINRTRADVFHEPHYTLPYFVKPPSVVTIHDLIQIKFPEYFSPLQRVYAGRMIHHACHSATAIIVDSEHTRGDLEDFHPGSASRTSVIPLGVSDRFFVLGEVGEGELTIPGISGGAPYILYVGSLRPHKNIPTLLKTFSQLKNREVRLVMVGESLQGRPQLASLAAQLNIASRVVSTGWVSDGDLAGIYRGACAVVVPSRYEGFGFPVLEAMAAGAPVISSRAASLPEVVGDAGILFDPDQPEELRYGLDRLLDSETLRADLREQGIRRARQFTWKRCAERTLKVYKSLAQG
jgi:glycosyltransferase involved in cell wall biosynthesis